MIYIGRAVVAVAWHGDGQRLVIKQTTRKHAKLARTEAV